MPVSFQWMLNGKQVPEFISRNIAIFGKKTSVLNIDSVDEKYAGNYTCVVTNRAESQHIQLSWLSRVQ